MPDIDNLRVFAGQLNEPIQKGLGYYLDRGRNREGIAYLRGVLDASSSNLTITEEQDRFVRGFLDHYSKEPA